MHDVIALIVIIIIAYYTYLQMDCVLPEETAVAPNPCSLAAEMATL